MKRKFVLTLLALAALAIVVFAGCEQELSPLEIVQQGYNSVDGAKNIRQQITVTRGMLVEYESDKTFAKTDDGYSVSGTEKRTNPLTDDETAEAQTVTTVNEHRNFPSEFLPIVSLKESYFKQGYVLTATQLTAQIVNGREREVLGIKEQLPAPTDNLTLFLSLDGSKLARFAITYNSDGALVEITLTFTY